MSAAPHSRQMERDTKRPCRLMRELRWLMGTRKGWSVFEAPCDPVWTLWRLKRFNYAELYVETEGPTRRRHDAAGIQRGCHAEENFLVQRLVKGSGARKSQTEHISSGLPPRELKTKDGKAQLTQAIRAVR